MKIEAKDNNATQELSQEVSSGEGKKWSAIEEKVFDWQESFQELERTMVLTNEIRKFKRPQA